MKVAHVVYHARIKCPHNGDGFPKPWRSISRFQALSASGLILDLVLGFLMSKQPILAWVEREILDTI